MQMSIQARCESSTLCLLDADGDGYGDSNAPAPYHVGTDCDDSNALNSPFDNDGDGASFCGGDCDDDNAELNISDADGDGFTVALVTVTIRCPHET